MRTDLRHRLIYEHGECRPILAGERGSYTRTMMPVIEKEEDTESEGCHEASGAEGKPEDSTFESDVPHPGEDE